MKFKYVVVLVISVLLVSLSIGTSILNYQRSLEQTHEQLVTRSLPLSIDNIYTEIQKNIIEPNLISSMMASNTFLRDWLINEEQNVDKITKYLNTVKNKYAMFNAFLVSDKSKNYYSSKGFLEKVDEKNPNNAWYFKFKELQNHHEINLDYNIHMGESMIFFINYKIFDYDFHYLGATGIALKTSYINKMLSFFRNTYNFNVYFINKKGEVVLSETGVNKLQSIQEKPQLYAARNDILIQNAKNIEYQDDSGHYLVKSKYIKELDLYLMVEAKIENFTQQVKQTFYLNLLASLFVTLVILLIILYTIKTYNKQLLHLANYDDLTKLPNRRVFNENFEMVLAQFQRDQRPKGMILFDIDNFKYINDNYGHLTGDKVLQRIGEILMAHTRKTDYLARWGGEEFTVMCLDTNEQQTVNIAQKIRQALSEDIMLCRLIEGGVTASFGVTIFKEDDTKDMVMNRADKALYEAKNAGKNCTKVKL